MVGIKNVRLWKQIGTANVSFRKTTTGTGKTLKDSLVQKSVNGR